MDASCGEALYQRIECKNKAQRVLDIIIFFLYLSLITIRLFSLNQHGIPWVLAFLCESWLAFICFLTLNARWNPVRYKTFPENLSHEDLPAVDMFVTTADPVLEPPIITINTVLSLLAMDYPSHKLACYVSDDAASFLTFFSLVETINFANLWVPFCKTYGIPVRAPFRYFSTLEDGLVDAKPSDFHLQHQQIKAEYEKLVQKIQAAIDQPLLLTSNQDFEAFSGIKVNDHASIIKVIWENKEGRPDGLPHLVYISREKRPKHPHHYKAGAMNVLTRVSGVMTNAPFMLNVDCDMYANNPQIAMHAMCLLLGLNETDIAFVQSPQYFYSGPNEASQIFQKYEGRGITGLGAYFYTGTGCFHRRKVIYGTLPGDEIEGRTSSLVDQKTVLEELPKKFGNSMDLTKSVAKILSGAPPNFSICPTSQLSTLVDAALKVADCNYEHDTHWGKSVGLLYGSTTEDLITSMAIHSKGWKSVSCTPEPPAFLGCAPMDTPTAMSQQRRWSTGMLENLFSYTHHHLWATLNGRLGFRIFLAYMWFNLTGIKSTVDMCYVLLPAYCIMTNSYFLPKGLALCVPLALFVISMMCSLSKFIRCGLSVRAWWNYYRMNLIFSATAKLFGVVSMVYKLVGVSQPVFEITRKGKAGSASGMTFDDSPIYVPATTLTLVHLVCHAMAVLALQKPINGHGGSGIGELACSVWVMISFWPFVEGLVRKGSNGIPCSTICKSAALALLFVQFCRSTTWV